LRMLIFSRQKDWHLFCATFLEILRFKPFF